MNHSYGDLWRLIRSGRPAKGVLVLAAILSLLSAVAMLAFPVLIQHFVDQLGKGAGHNGLGWAILVTLSGGLLLGAISNVMLARIGHAVSAELRHLLIGKMFRLPVAFFDSTDTGEKVSRVANDCESISDLTSTQAVSMINGVVMLIGSISILFWLDAQLTMVLFAALLIAFMSAGPAMGKMQKLARDLQEHTAKLSGILTHIFSEVRLVKACAAEPHERARSRKVIEHLKEHNYRVARLRIILETIAGLAVMSALAVILVYGGVRIGRGDLSIGVMTAFILYIFNISGPLSQLGVFVAELQKAKGASTRLTAILHEREEHLSASTIKPARGRTLEFRDISFGYPGHEAAVIKKLNLILEPGTTTALVGVSGSGKSTILSLIERFYEPSDGTLLYDGSPVAEYDITAWRQNIGLVPQNSPIMPGSVRDNITYGIDRLCSDDEIRAAANEAQALDFINDLPDGFDTHLIEQGMNLSGGQRQRISIARVFLSDPDFLLLDEATSSLDSETEHHIRIALDRLMQNRTNIVIAHRLSTIIHADRICLVENGKIAGIGNHQVLYEQNRTYAALVDRQLGARQKQ